MIERDVPPRAAWALEQAGVPPLLARLLAARGVREAQELDDGLARLLPPQQLAGCTDGARLLADALAAGERICIVADYDCDGATACAVALRGLRLLGGALAAARGTPAPVIGYVVPDRAVHGYGLTPAIVELARAQAPRVLVTVDNGIASVEGVAHARACGMRVLVTDHHLPAVDDAGQVRLPEADVIVNPNQPGCDFPSKAIAGVGVMFYVLMALRAELRARGVWDEAGVPQPRLDTLLDLVALGTVADVVKLDANNRRLVAQGLKRVRAGQMQPGVAALFTAAGRQPARASAQDFAFALGPRINAAGRLSDMTLGIECLATDDSARALQLAQQLDAINRERRVIETEMRLQAEARLDEQLGDLLQACVVATAASTDSTATAAREADGAVGRADADQPAGTSAATERAAAAAIPPALVLFDPEFHEGIVGIVAGRIKDRLHRPTFVLARGQDGWLKGSGRSIPGFHLRDALDLVAKRHPGLFQRFGGHAMAAGCTLAEADWPRFAQALREVAAAQLAPDTLARRLSTDGPLPAEHWQAQTVAALDAQVWGQGFEPPLFCDEVQVIQQRLVGEKHLKLRVRCTARPDAAPRDAIWFGHTEPVPERVRLAYRVALDEFQGQSRLQMVVEAAVG
ncbi:single-stranded-DNA-specific exonuclease RecJ [Pseudaquabacterium rugosum]|uniref:single-stranded-DNA-specific exonuclease RecJ n=1 Tax=Pseudaquabacterium rugosum TaxID=2984194 RepID=UPI003BF99FA7